MYAIIRAGGHQEKVTVGEQITVDRLKQEVGEEVRYVPLMVHKDDGTVVSDRRELEAGASVVGRVLEHTRADKIDVFQYRQKTGYRRHIGHRQPVTLVEIAEIRYGDLVERAEEQAAAEAAAPAEDTPGEAAEEEEPAPQRKPAAGKAAGAKKAPARKATPKKK